MRTLVCDSSVLIELSKHRLLDKLFELGLTFAVPDVLFSGELVYLGTYSRNDLLAFGLRVESLDPNGLEIAIGFRSRRRALSLVDSFVLALASQRGWGILTEDRAMRDVAKSEGIGCYDTLWVIDNMVDAGVLDAGRFGEALQAMLDDPGCPVPNSELARRLRSLGG